jgi:tetratricopeptide (TPR) repeat protein
MTIALLALALALPASLLVLWPFLVGRRDALAPASADDGRTPLEAEKREALRALRELDLDHEAGHVAAEDYALLRARYEARASEILTQLDALPPAPPPARPVARPAATARPASRVPWTRHPVTLGLTGGALLVLGVAIGLLVTRFSTPEPPDPSMTMGTMGATGAMGALGPGPAGPAAGESGGPPQPLPEGMLAGMLRAAHAALDAGRYQEAIAAYKAILRREPRNVEAITHLGVILGLAGHADPALEAFDRAIGIDPRYAHAWWDKARVLFEQKQDYAGAIAAWERFAQVAPPGPDREQAAGRIREARARLSGAAPAAPPAAKP